MSVALDLETRLKLAYDRHFTRHKRQPTRALGWPATLWLVNALDNWNAKTVLECGAGWSTTALRMWQAERFGREVTTTDHKPAWLNLALQECLMERLDVDRFVNHDDLPKYRTHDAVLVDLADTPTRYAKLDDFIRWTAPGGHLVFDDWHVASYRDDVNAWLIKHGQRIAEPILASTDEWGRYLAVWRAP